MDDLEDYIEKFQDQKMNKKFEDFPKHIKNQILEIEKELILQDQIEITNIMPYPVEQIYLWMNNAI